MLIYLIVLVAMTQGILCASGGVQQKTIAEINHANNALVLSTTAAEPEDSKEESQARYSFSYRTAQGTEFISHIATLKYLKTGETFTQTIICDPKHPAKVRTEFEFNTVNRNTQQQMITDMLQLTTTRSRVLLAKKHPKALSDLDNETYELNGKILKENSEKS